MSNNDTNENKIRNLKIAVLIQGFIIVALAGNILLSRNVQYAQPLPTTQTTQTQQPNYQTTIVPGTPPIIEDLVDEETVPQDDKPLEEFEIRPYGDNFTLESNNMPNVSMLDLADENGFVVNDGVLVSYIGGENAVTIPETVTTISSDAFLYGAMLRSVTIPDTVTKIEDNAFSNCEKLTYVEHSNSLETVGYKAFVNTPWYDGLNDEYNIIGDGILVKYVPTTNTVNNNNPNIITLPNTVKSIAGGAFSSCTTLQSVTISDTVTHIGDSAFEACWGLSTINVPATVEFIGDYAFDDTTWFYNLEDEFCIAGASTLIKYNGMYTNISIPNFVTNISAGVFQDFNSIETITIPNTVTRIGEKAFAGCISLNSLNIPDTVTYIGDDAFFDTVWFINLNETFNLVGDGILIKYTGNSANVRIEEPVKVIYQNVFANSKSMSGLIIETEVDINENALNYNNYMGKIFYDDDPIRLQEIVEKYEEVSQNIIFEAAILSQKDYLEAERVGEMEYYIYVLEDDEVTVIASCDTGHEINAEWRPSLKDGYQIVIRDNGEILFANLD